MTNTDVWHGLSENEVEELEEVDKLLLRRILQAPTSTCIESVYLELGVTRLKVIIVARRVNYLHYLANLKENEMLYKVFYAQWKHPVKDDWTIQVQQNLEDFELDMTLDDFKKKSANSFKRMMKIKSKEYTLNYLLEIKDSHSKMDNLEYPELKLQNYLRDDEIPLNEARNLYGSGQECQILKKVLKMVTIHVLFPARCVWYSQIRKHTVTFLMKIYPRISQKLCWKYLN